MRLSKIIGFFICLALFLPFAGQSAVVLKKKGKQVLIHLKGLQTKRGAYLQIIDPYDEHRGIVQIKRVANKKAIGILRYGVLAKKWSLKPISKRKAILLQKKAKRKRARIARIQREKIKRKLAYKKHLKRKRALKRKLAERRKAAQRKLATYEEPEDYIISDFPKESAEQSEEVLSYNTQSPEEKNFSHSNNHQEYNENPYKNSQYNNQQHNNRLAEGQHFYPVERDRFTKNFQPTHFRRFSLGIAPRLEYSFMKINPLEGETSYTMSGLGYGIFISTGFALNRYISAEGILGGKKSSFSAKEEECGKPRGCSIDIYYLSAGLNLKVNLLEFFEHKLWVSGEGILMQPLAYSNNILTDESFSPIHGTVGGALGLDLTWGNVVTPISIRGGVYMPTTETTITGNIGLQMGIAYRF